MNTIIPTRLHRVKTFECREHFQSENGGRTRIDTLSQEASIEVQIDAWVNETKNLIVATGPLHVQQSYPSGGVVQETRTLAVTYVPAVEQSNVKYPGEPGAGPIQPVAQLREPVRPAPVEGDGGAGGRARGPLRLPPVS